MWVTVTLTAVISICARNRKLEKLDTPTLTRTQSHRDTHTLVPVG